MLRFTSVAAFLACILTLAAGQAHAQTPLRILAGPTFSNVSTDEWDTSSKLGFFAAVGTSFALSENVFVSPFVGYVQKGAEFSDGTQDTYSYIEIPVLLGTQIAVSETASLSLSVGPQVAFNINCDEDGYDCSEYDDFKGTEFGIVAGAGFNFPISDPYIVSLGASYDYGLTDVFDGGDGYKNRVFYLWISLGTVIGG